MLGSHIIRPYRAWGKRIVISLAGILVITQLLAVAYHQGTQFRQDDLASLSHQELQASRVALMQLQANSQAQVDMLSSRMAVLQARLARLDALGDRLVEVSGLPNEGGEFDFTSEPGLGGRDATTPQEGAKADVLSLSLALLKSQVEDREMQLRILQDVLHDRNIAIEAMPNHTPVRTGWISSGYGWRKDPFHGRRMFHHGVDIAARYKTQIQAAAAGLVTFSGHKSGYGKVVEINHGNGYRSRYAHAYSLLVKKGEIVSRGQPIALVGSTGRSTGPHLHFEVLEDGKSVNPMSFLSRR